MKHGYPRPQLVRDQWTSLDGAWQFAFDDDGNVHRPEQVQWTREIVVPFAPEAPASGIGDTGFHAVCWYRRAFDAPALTAGERLILHFGAVDYSATVWVNAAPVATHEGGYTPFGADITEYLIDGPQTVAVRAEDDPHDMAKPRGKQDWELEPHGIWYPRTSGIWQTVWLERVPATRIASLRWTPDYERWQIALRAQVDGVARDDLRVRARLSVTTRSGDARVLADDVYAIDGPEVARTIELADPGLDAPRFELAWSPSSPTLIDAQLELLDHDGNALDSVSSYTALRSVAIDGDAFLLNGRPYRPRMVLDQGYWPESGLTAPSDEALRRDVELAKNMGFTGVRKHQKIEDPRYLYWADRLGLLVWEEMPSAYRFTPEAVRRLSREWVAAVERDVSHPCIVAWVPFNESWGVPDLPGSPEQRAYVRAMYELTKALDSSRPVIGNDGWEHVAADIIGIHDYDNNPATLEARYADASRIDEVRPGGRRLLLDRFAREGRPLMLTEFGGVAYAPDEASTWGYARARTPEDLAGRYEALVAAVHASSNFAGSCYTQFADTYQEANGLLFADRSPKFPLDEMNAITRGKRARGSGA